jgi:hypothetical protein
MSPLDRLDWLRRVRDAGASLSALAVAIEVAFRDGGDGAWGHLEGGSIRERAGRNGRAWLVAAGFLSPIRRGWTAVYPQTGTVMPESGTVVPERHDGAGIRHDGAAVSDEGTRGMVVPESGTMVPQENNDRGTVVPPKRHDGAAEPAPPCRPTLTQTEHRQNQEAPPPSPSSSPQPDDTAAAAAALREVVDVLNRDALRQALADRALLGIVAAFKGNTDDGLDEWTNAADGMPLGTLAAVFLWRSRTRNTIRRPSGLREARREFQALPISERMGWAGEINALVLRKSA